MPVETYLNAALGLCFIIGLIFMCAYFAKKFGINSNVTGKSIQRIKLLASRSLDVKTKVVLLQKDDVEYFILVGPQSAEVLDRSEVKKSKKHNSSPKAEGKSPLNARFHNYKRRDD